MGLQSLSLREDRGAEPLHRVPGRKLGANAKDGKKREENDICRLLHLFVWPL